MFITLLKHLPLNRADLFAQSQNRLIRYIVSLWCIYFFTSVLAINTLAFLIGLPKIFGIEIFLSPSTSFLVELLKLFGPDAIAISLPVAHIFALLGVIIKLRQMGFLQFFILRNLHTRRLIFIAYFLSLACGLLMDVLSRDIHANIETLYWKALKTGSMTQIPLRINSFGFHKVGRFVVFQGGINQVSQKPTTTIYELEGTKIIFAGNGYFDKNSNSITNISGVQFDKHAKTSRITRKNLSLQKDILSKNGAATELRKSLAYLKLGLSDQRLPFTMTGQKFGYPYPRELEILQLLQRLFFALCPAFSTSIFLLLLAFWRSSRFNLNYNLILGTISSTVFLIFPMTITLSYHEKPNFLPFAGIALWIGIIVAFWRFYLPLSNKFLTIFRKLKATPKKVKFITYPVQRSRISKFLIAKSKIAFLIFKYSFFLFVILFGLALQYELVYRFVMNWKLNKGIDDLAWFLTVQLLSIPDIFLSYLPNMLVICIPFIIFFIRRKNIVLRMRIQKSISVNLLVFCAILLGMILCFQLRENFGAILEKKSYDIFIQKIYPTEAQERFKNNVDGKFLLLPDQSILYFSQIEKTADVYKIVNVYNDRIHLDGSFTTSAKADVLENRIHMQGGFIESVSTPQATKESFDKKILNTQSDFKTYMELSFEMKYLNVHQLYILIKMSDTFLDSQNHRIQHFFRYRTIPYLTSIMIFVLTFIVMPWLLFSASSRSLWFYGVFCFLGQILTGYFIIFAN